MKYGIYIHIPFCRKKCLYCNFYSVPVAADHGSGILETFTSRILDEIGRRFTSFSDQEVDTIYLGGGTPSILSAAEVGRILEGIGRHMHVAGDAEITIEMNPSDASREKIEGFVDAGITRIVLGYQTSNEYLHSLIGRSSSPCDRDTLDLFFSLSGYIRCIDVIMGIPEQRVEDLIDELGLVVQYGPEHISAYLLSVEGDSPLRKRCASDRRFEQRQRECMEAGMSFLAGRGYSQYEISNYAIPGFESRHNLKYWTFQPYIGLGPHSHSFYCGERYSVNMSVDQYLASDRVILEKDRRGPGSAAVEFILTGMRMMQGISVACMREKTGSVLTDQTWRVVDDLKNEGFIAVDFDGNDAVLRLTRKGIFFSDSVIYRLVEHMIAS